MKSLYIILIILLVVGSIGGYMLGKTQIMESGTSALVFRTSINIGEDVLMSVEEACEETAQTIIQTNYLCTADKFYLSGDYLCKCQFK